MSANTMYPTRLFYYTVGVARGRERRKRRYTEDRIHHLHDAAVGRVGDRSIMDPASQVSSVLGLVLLQDASSTNERNGYS